MAPRKGRDTDLNGPLQKLAESLRALQQEAGQVLENVRAEPSADTARTTGDAGDLAATFEAQISRRAAALLERWDMPTRTELGEIVERIERLEQSVAALQKPSRKPKTTKIAARTSKTRRNPVATKRRKT